MDLIPGSPELVDTLIDRLKLLGGSLERIVGQIPAAVSQSSGDYAARYAEAASELSHLLISEAQGIFRVVTVLTMYGEELRSALLHAAQAISLHVSGDEPSDDRDAIPSGSSFPFSERARQILDSALSGLESSAIIATQVIREILEAEIPRRVLVDTPDSGSVPKIGKHWAHAVSDHGFDRMVGFVNLAGVGNLCIPDLPSTECAAGFGDLESFWRSWIPVPGELALGSGSAFAHFETDTSRPRYEMSFDERITAMIRQFDRFVPSFEIDIEELMTNPPPESNPTS